MSILARTISCIAALAPLLAFPAERPTDREPPGATDSKWLYGGEMQGIAFQLRITGACKDGSKVAVRLKRSSDEDLVVSFRLNDADWRKTFTRKLEAGAREATLTFAPEEDGQVCHPYVDQVEVAEAAPAEVPYTPAEAPYTPAEAPYTPAEAPYTPAEAPYQAGTTPDASGVPEP